MEAYSNILKVMLKDNPLAINLRRPPGRDREIAFIIILVVPLKGFRHSYDRQEPLSLSWVDPGWDASFVGAGGGGVLESVDGL